MPKRTSNYQDWLLQELTDPEVAANYVNAAVGDSPEMLLKALRNVAESMKMATVAEKAKVNRENLYRMLSEEGNPRFSTFMSVLAALGLGFKVEPLIAATAGQKNQQPETTGVRQEFCDGR